MALHLEWLTEFCQEEPDDTQLPELETQVRVLHQSERVPVPPSDYIPQMGSKTYAMITENAQRHFQRLLAWLL